ncbi:MAG: hypothetical protein PHW74_01355 [Desulfobacca sp.]|nr:hypothetical protein [Desulfobacca sp.]
MDYGGKWRDIKQLGLQIASVIILAVVFMGCQSQEPSLSPAATSLKQNLKKIIDNFSLALGKPIADQDKKSINLKLEELFKRANSQEVPGLLDITVLDHKALRLASHPEGTNNVQSFSNYRTVRKALAEGKIVQARLFFQDGFRLYVICVPTLHKHEVKGLIILCFDATAVNNQSGVTEEEFLAIDFNR